MFKKKVYLPIGALLITICLIGLFALRSDTPKEASQGGHVHSDGTWHNQPHTEETAQEKFNREMIEELKRLQAENAKYKAELDKLKSKSAERTEYPSRITEKGKKVVSEFPDILERTPKNTQKQAKETDLSRNKKSLEQQLIDVNYELKRLQWKIDDLGEGKEF